MIVSVTLPGATGIILVPETLTILELEDQGDFTICFCCKDAGLLGTLIQSHTFGSDHGRDSGIGDGKGSGHGAGVIALACDVYSGSTDIDVIAVGNSEISIWYKHFVSGFHSN